LIVDLDIFNRFTPYSFKLTQLLAALLFFHLTLITIV